MALISHNKVMKSKFIIVFLWGLVSLCNAQDVYLYTPNGSQVYAYEEPEMSSSDIAYCNAECASSYPNAEILATATATYNCHSYAWNLMMAVMSKQQKQTPRKFFTMLATILLLNLLHMQENMNRNGGLCL